MDITLPPDLTLGLHDLVITNPDGAMGAARGGIAIGVLLYMPFVSR